MRRSRRNRGFSLLEVVISLGFLMTLTVAVTTMLRAGFDVKEGLSQRARVLHRLSVAMEKVARDLQHVFIVPNADTERNGIGRTTKTVFAIEEGGEADRLLMTTKSKLPRVKGKPESDLTYVIYQLADAKDAPGRKHLYRAESPAIPLDLKEEPPGRIIARNILAFQVEYWNGEKWASDRWDSDSRETRNKVPRMVRITMRTHLYDRENAEEPLDEAAEKAYDELQTVIYIPEGDNYPELKAQTSSIRWDRL